MSTVLWCNKLIDGVSSGPEDDLYLLYEYTEALDQICSSEKLPLFSSIQDFTDMMVNLEELELPEGEEDTIGLMISQGTWVDASQALLTMRGLHTYLVSNADTTLIPSSKINDLLHELSESIRLAEEAEIANGKFNFSVVM